MTHTSIGTISAASLVTLLTAGCASAPPAARPTTDPNLALDMKIEQKMSLLLQLEDRRILEAPAAPAPAPAPAAPARGRARTTVAPSPAPVVPPDLTSLLADAEPRVRRRAALAIGRVGLPDGIMPLIATLADNDPDVREMAAFALGLIGDVSAAPPLTRRWPTSRRSCAAARRKPSACSGPRKRIRSNLTIGVLRVSRSAAWSPNTRAGPVIASMGPDDETVARAG